MPRQPSTTVVLTLAVCPLCHTAAGDREVTELTWRCDTCDESWTPARLEAVRRYVELCAPRVR